MLFACGTEPKIVGLRLSPLPTLYLEAALKMQIYSFLAILILAPVVGESARADPAPEPAYRQLEIRRLFEPTASELRNEAKGSVYIYEGMTDRAVNQAMEDEFERVEHMMFINTIRTDAQGKPLRDPDTGLIEADDDCCPAKETTQAIRPVSSLSQFQSSHHRAG